MSKSTKKSESAADAILALEGAELLAAIDARLLANIEKALAEKNADPKLPLVHAMGIFRNESGKYVPFAVKIRGDRVVENEVLASSQLPLHLAMNVFQAHSRRSFRAHVALSKPAVQESK